MDSNEAGKPLGKRRFDGVPESVSRAVSILIDDLDSEAMVELIHSFLADSAARLADLEALSQGPDQPTLRRTAHSLKGSAALFGLRDLEMGAAKVERLAEQGEVQGQAEAVRVVIEAHRQARGWMETLLKELTKS